MLFMCVCSRQMRLASCRFVSVLSFADGGATCNRSYDAAVLQFTISQKLASIRFGVLNEAVSADAMQLVDMPNCSLFDQQGLYC